MRTVKNKNTNEDITIEQVKTGLISINDCTCPGCGCSVILADGPINKFFRGLNNRSHAEWCKAKTSLYKYIDNNNSGLKINIPRSTIVPPTTVTTGINPIHTKDKKDNNIEKKSVFIDKFFEFLIPLSINNIQNKINNSNFTVHDHNNNEGPICIKQYFKDLRISSPSYFNGKDLNRIFFSIAKVSKYDPSLKEITIELEHKHNSNINTYCTIKYSNDQRNYDKLVEMFINRDKFYAFTLGKIKKVNNYNNVYVISNIIWSEIVDL
jgi:hypothetical protein